MKRRSLSCEGLQVPLEILDELAAEFLWNQWIFDALCDCVKHTYNITMPSRFIDSVLTVVGVDLTVDATFASLAGATSTPFRLCDSSGYVLLGDPIFLIISATIGLTISRLVQVVCAQCCLLPRVWYCLQFRQPCDVIRQLLKRALFICFSLLICCFY